MIMERFALTERRACRILEQPRASQRYVPVERPDEAPLVRSVIELATQYGRYGYRIVTGLLNLQGWQVGKDRVYRIWRQEGLKTPKKQKPRGRLWLNDGSCLRLRPLFPNHVWSYDFVSFETHDRRKVRALNIIDEFSRECLAIYVARHIRAQQVIGACTEFCVNGLLAGNCRIVWRHNEHEETCSP
jgi:putative transposase